MLSRDGDLKVQATGLEVRTQDRCLEVRIRNRGEKVKTQT